MVVCLGWLVVVVSSCLRVAGVSRETLVLLYDVPRMSMVSRETGILEITISFMVTYRCFTWNVCGDVRGAEE